MAANSAAGLRWRFSGELSAAVPVGWRATEALVLTSGDGRVRLQAERIPGAFDASGWTGRRLEALGEVLVDLQRRSVADHVTIGGQERPAVAFEAGPFEPPGQRVTGLSVLLGAAGAEVVVTAFGPTDDDVFDRLLDLIEQTDVIAAGEPLTWSLAFDGDDGARPGDAARGGGPADWTGPRAVWADPVTAPTQPAEPLFVGTHEELAVVTGMLGLGAPAGIDVRWLGALDADQRLAVSTAASRSLLVKGYLVRDERGGVEVASVLREALVATTDADLVVDVAETMVGPDGFERQSVVLAHPHTAVEVMPVSLEAAVVRSVDPETLVARFVAGSPDGADLAEVPLDADAFEQLVGAGRVGDTGLPELPDGSSLIAVRALHRTGKGVEGGEVRWIRMPGVGDWEVYGGGVGLVLRPLTRQRLHGLLLDMLPGPRADS